MLSNTATTRRRISSRWRTEPSSPASLPTRTLPPPSCSAWRRSTLSATGPGRPQRSAPRPSSSSASRVSSGSSSRHAWPALSSPSSPGPRNDETPSCSPSRRQTLLLLSEFQFRNAVISQRNGEMVMMFRIGNMRSSHLLQAQVRAQMVHKVVTEEGENIYHYQQELPVRSDCCCCCCWC